MPSTAVITASVDSSSTTSVRISLTMADDLTATDYTISYSNTYCPTDTYDDITDISPSETMYTLTGLEEGTNYSITVTVALSGGGTGEDSLTATTMTAGKSTEYPISFSLLYSDPLTHTAPSAPPSSVRVYALNSTAISVQWGPVDCVHRNGDITGYTVQYKVVGSAEGERTVKMASEDFSGGIYTISGLSAATEYTVEVAAENSAGTGAYSGPVVSETPQSKQYWVMWCMNLDHTIQVYISV